MGIISRYILRNHAAPFFFGTFTVLFIFIFQFIIKYIDQLLGKGLDAWVVIQLIGLNVASMLVLAIPMGVLFSTLMSFGSMSASHEVTIVKASGGSLLRMMFPVLVFGGLLTLFVFWFNDQVLPDANHRAKNLMYDIQRKKPTFSIEPGNFSTELDGYIIFARKVDSISGKLFGVTIYDNTKLRTQNIISADTGIVKFTPDYSKLVMDLYNGEIHQITQNSFQNYRIIDFSKYKIFMEARGYNFQRTSLDMTTRGDRELKIADMQKIIDVTTKSSNEVQKRIDIELEKHFNYLSGKDAHQGGYAKFLNNAELAQNKDIIFRNVDQRVFAFSSALTSNFRQKSDYHLKINDYEVEIYKKYAIPFACLIFVLIGCPLGIITRGGNFGLSAAMSLGFYIFYWACLIGGEKLADRGLLSPTLSMWNGNIIIGILGIILTSRVNFETFSPRIFFKNKFFSKFKRK